MANIYDFNSASLGFDSYDTNLFAKDIIIAQDQLFGNSAQPAYDYQATFAFNSPQHHHQHNYSLSSFASAAAPAQPNPIFCDPKALALPEMYPDMSQCYDVAPFSSLLLAQDNALNAISVPTPTPSPEPRKRAFEEDDEDEEEEEYKKIKYTFDYLPSPRDEDHDELAAVTQVDFQFTSPVSMEIIDPVVAPVVPVVAVPAPVAKEQPKKKLTASPKKEATPPASSSSEERRVRDPNGCVPPWSQTRVDWRWWFIQDFCVRSLQSPLPPPGTPQAPFPQSAHPREALWLQGVWQDLFAQR